METIPINILKEFYTLIDKEINSFPKVCKKGCFACCYQPIELLSFEQATLADFIKNKMSDEQRESIKTKTSVWLDFFDENTSNVESLSVEEAFVDFRYRAEGIPFPCPLLSDGKCSVYAVRPLTCRTHFVNDDKKYCEQDKLRDGAKESMGYRNNTIQKIKSGGIQIEVIPLTYALVEILNMDRKTKKIDRAEM